MSSLLRKLFSCCASEEEPNVKGDIELQKYSSTEANRAEPTTIPGIGVDPESSRIPPQLPASSEGQPLEQLSSGVIPSTSKQQQPSSLTTENWRSSQIVSFNRLPEWPPPHWRTSKLVVDSDPDAITPVNPHEQPYNRVQDVLEERRKTLERLRRPPAPASPVANGHPKPDSPTPEDPGPERL